MASKKRTRNGEVKPSDSTQQAPEDVPVAEPTPPCGQSPKPSSTSNESQNKAQINTLPEAQEDKAPEPSKPTHQPPTKPSRSRKQKRQSLPKRPKLPENATITRRPLLHPALPTPFASSHAPKVLYITVSSPFIPALKRIRKLLAEIEKRERQSVAANSRGKGRAEANGRLKNGDVERGVADEAARLKGIGVGRSGEGKNKECVYLKAAGRAIPRALELGVQFQGEECVVKVETGSVKAIDDIEVKSRSGSAKDGEEEVAEEEADEDAPETRIRTISSVTVSIRVK